MKKQGRKLFLAVAAAIMVLAVSGCGQRERILTTVPDMGLDIFLMYMKDLTTSIGELTKRVLPQFWKRA